MAGVYMEIQYGSSLWQSIRGTYSRGKQFSCNYSWCIYHQKSLRQSRTPGMCSEIATHDSRDPELDTNISGVELSVF